MPVLDSAFAISSGLAFLALVFLFHAINILMHKIRIRQFDWSFSVIFALTILTCTIFTSRILYMAGKYPWLDYKGIVSGMLYLPFTLSFSTLAILILIKTIIGEQYPRGWLIYAAISGILMVVSYVWL